MTAADPFPEPPVVAAIRARRGNAVRAVEHNRGQYRVTIDREALVEVVTALRDDPARMFYVLRSMTRREEVVLVCLVPEDDCKVPTVAGVYLCANGLERECYDMFGIHFTGHPDLRRILMPEVFTDFPLRKDFPMQGKMTDQEWAEWIIAQAQRTEGDPA
jgi:NADH-quinone oxidoreductase subunit C